MPSLDPLEERILVWIAGRQGHRLAVRDMLAHSEFGAPATIHARLKSLRAKRWIALADTPDARRKQIQLTPDALAHFARLSRLMVKAVKS